MFDVIRFKICRNASLDVEPLYTFRSHEGPVVSLVMSSTGEHVYSASVDGTIKVWTLPNSNIDPYDSFGKQARVSLPSVMTGFELT